MRADSRRETGGIGPTPTSSVASASLSCPATWPTPVRGTEAGRVADRWEALLEPTRSRSVRPSRSSCSYSARGRPRLRGSRERSRLDLPGSRSTRHVDATARPDAGASRCAESASGANTDRPPDRRTSPRRRDDPLTTTATSRRSPAPPGSRPSGLRAAEASTSSATEPAGVRPRTSSKRGSSRLCDNSSTTPVARPSRVYLRGMPRPLRITAAETLYHVCVRATGGGDLFVDLDDRHRLLRLLKYTCKRHGWLVDAYAQLTTHHHLLVWTPEDNLSRGMQLLSGIVRADVQPRARPFRPLRLRALHGEDHRHRGVREGGLPLHRAEPGARRPLRSA